MKQVLNETNIEENRDVTANTVFAFAMHIINSLLTELVRSVQEDTAGLVLFLLVCGPRLRLGPKLKRKKNSTVQYPPVRTSRSVNNIYVYFLQVRAGIIMNIIAITVLLGWTHSVGTLWFDLSEFPSWATVDDSNATKCWA